jgi:FkbM family methyltransferase
MVSRCSVCAVLVLGCIVTAAVAEFRLGDGRSSLHASALNSLIHQGFSLAVKRGHDLKKEGGKIVVRYVRLDDEHTFLSAVPVGMKTAATVVQENIADTGMWSPSETQVLLEILSRNCGQAGKPQLLLDVGCNVGWFCSVAAAYGCKCMAFDGSLEATTYVKMTSQLNGWGKRMSINAALVSNDTRVTFNGWTVKPSNTDAASSRNDAFTASSVRLDDVVKEPIVFMKVDVEGWEPSVFDSAAQLIAETPPPYVYFEITYYLLGEWKTQYIQTLNFLHLHGYRCAQLHDRKRIPNLKEVEDAKAWFEALQSSPICDSTKRHFCQEEIFCLHITTTFIPSALTKLLGAA